MQEISVNAGRVIKLDLADNQLSGQIPRELGNPTYLKEFSLGANQLSGQTPQELGKLTQVDRIWLADNPSLCIPASLLEQWPTPAGSVGNIPRDTLPPLCNE